MTARWSPTEDTSDLTAEANDDALHELYTDRGEWPTEAELADETFWRERERNEEWWA